MTQLSLLKGTASRRTPRGGVIYESKGRAREYRELACNLYSGCDHGCLYCYGPNTVQRNRQAFHSGVVPRSDILRKLAKDAAYYAAAGERRQVLLCFICDPYCLADTEHQITRSAIEILHDHGLAVCILTKGGARSLRDLDLFTPKDAYAATLTFTDPQDSLEWEPNAAPPEERLNALQRFHQAGIPTWVSLEPVIDPRQTMELVRISHTYVDEFKVGVLNYHAAAQSIDWGAFGQQIVSLLEELGCRYYLKRDLRRFMK